MSKRVLTIVFTLIVLCACGRECLILCSSGQHGCAPNTVVLKKFQNSTGGDAEELLEEHYPLEEVAGIFKLTSGGLATITRDGRLRTLQGDLDPSNKWFNLYSKNPDTLFGRRPQNVFRVYVDTCLLSIKKGFYISFGALATDHVPPREAAYLGGFDAIAQWWSPGNPNPAFLCKDQYGGFCGNVGYHTKLQSTGALEIARERPPSTDPANRYTTLKRLEQALPGVVQDQFPLNHPVKLRMEIKQEGEVVVITSCLDRDADGTWDVALTAEDKERPIAGFFVPIFRSDWMSAEFFDPEIGTLGDSQISCGVRQ